MGVIAPEVPPASARAGAESEGRYFGNRGKSALNPISDPRSNREGASARPHPAEKRLDVPETDFSALVRRCLDGDQQAWAELVSKQQRRVYALCYRFTNSAQDTQDLTQDVFVKVYGNLRSFDGGKGSFSTWIATLTRNLLVDHFRRSRQQRATDSIDAGWDQADEGPPKQLLTDQRTTPYEHVVQEQLERTVRSALARVSPELREAVILRDLQDMDYKEIAAVLAIPQGTVKSRISRGRAELARLLERTKGQVV